MSPQQGTHGNQMKIKPWIPLIYQARVLAVEALKIAPSAKALLAREDLGLFGEHILGLEPAEHHRGWLDHIVTGNSSPVLSRVSGSNLRIAAPRGSAKTTWISCAIAWVIGHNPHIRIILCSYSEEIALSISVAIKAIIESDKYREIFPEIQKSSRWRDKSWTIDRQLAAVDTFIKDPTVLAVGAQGAIASRRSDLVVIDDPIKSSRDIDNPHVRTAMVKWWSEVLKPTLVPGGRAIVLCTRYRVDDIHGTTFTLDKGWDVIEQAAIIQGENGEESFWSEYMSLEFLVQKREEDPVSFASQYQNDPLSEEGQIIKPDWITRADIPGAFDEIAIGVDLAASRKESADYTALVVCGRAADKYYILDFIRGRWSLNTSIEELIKLSVAWKELGKRFTVQVESVAFQAVFADEFRRRAISAGVSLRVESVTLKGDKEQRLHGVSGLFEAQLVVFNRAVATGVLIEEILQFGFVSHDDCADAMVHGLTKIFKKRRKLEVSVY